MYKGKNSDEAAARRSSCLFAFLRDYISAGHYSPSGTGLAGGGARWGSCPPTRTCSPEDRLRLRAQLRPGSGNRRTADCWNRTSVDKGSHRRKAPGPIRVVFAGAGARGKCVPPGRPCSPEDRLRLRAQLRPTFARRRRTNTEEPNSVEKGAHRRKAPVPVRGCFAGAGARGKCVPPGSLLSSEDSIRIRVQLRLGSGNRRRTNTEGPNSVEKGAHRRKAPAPVRVLSPEMVRARRSYLRLAFVRRRTASDRARSSGEPPVTGGK